MYEWDNCTRNTFERARGAVNCLIRNIIVHVLLGHSHSPLATNKHILHSCDNINNSNIYNYENKDYVFCSYRSSSQLLGFITEV